MIKVRLATALCFTCTVSAVQASDNLNAFPPAEQGMARYVLQLPAKKDEAAFRVELLVGKTVQTDSQNHYFFNGKVEEETIQGWGFTRYIVKDLGAMTGTLMAPDPRAPKAARFVTLGGEPQLLRYNSQLPMVVYVPKEAEVRYRIWAAKAKTKTMKKG